MGPWLMPPLLWMGQPYSAQGETSLESLDSPRVRLCSMGPGAPGCFVPAPTSGRAIHLVVLSFLPDSCATSAQPGTILAPSPHGADF